jgi:hypothetical protein
LNDNNNTAAPAKTYATNVNAMAARTNPESTNKTNTIKVAVLRKALGLFGMTTWDLAGTDAGSIVIARAV